MGVANPTKNIKPLWLGALTSHTHFSHSLRELVGSAHGLSRYLRSGWWEIFFSSLQVYALFSLRLIAIN